MFSGARVASDSTNVDGDDSNMYIGVATNNGQAVWAGGSDNGAATMQTISYCTDAECLAILSNALTGVDNRASFVQFLSNGWRLNVTETASNNDLVHWIAWKGGTYKVGSVTTQTDTVTDISSGSLGFAPGGALMISHGKAESSSDTAQNDDEWSIGAWSSISSRIGFGTMDVNGAASSLVATSVQHAGVYANIDTSGAIEGVMDIHAVGSDDFTMRMSDADPSSAFVWYFATAGTAAAPPPGESDPAPIGWFSPALRADGMF
jgi:hypothetical protein